MESPPLGPRFDPEGIYVLGDSEEVTAEEKSDHDEAATNQKEVGDVHPTPDADTSFAPNEPSLLEINVLDDE